MKGVVQQPPAIEFNWYWKVVRQYVSERYCIGLSRSSCLNYLQGLQASHCSRLMRRSGRPSWWSDEAHFRADAELRGNGCF